MLDSQTLRERQSIVRLRFYFSDDVTLNTFRVPFVIFTSKNDAFLQTHFSPISHGPNGTSSAACLSGRVSGPSSPRGHPTRASKSTWNTRMASCLSQMPFWLPARILRSRRTGNCSFTEINHRHKSKTVKKQGEKKKIKKGGERKEDVSLHLCESKAVTALQALGSFAHMLLPNI